MENCQHALAIGITKHPSDALEKFSHILGGEIVCYSQTEAPGLSPRLTWVSSMIAATLLERENLTYLPQAITTLEAGS